MEQTKILVVDDEARMRKLVKDFLTIKGYQVIEAGDGEEAVEIFFQQKDIALILLDVMMPKMDGWEVLKTIRLHSKVPIIMLTARGEGIDKINGLSIGADDYMTKPFQPLELVARVKAQLRRYKRYNAGPEHVSEIIVLSGLSLDIKSHTCTLNEHPLSLTPTEFSILQILCQNKGRVVSSEELFRQIWKDEYYTKNNNTITAHIRHLREKMGDSYENPKYIKTVWGYGYKIEN